MQEAGMKDLRIELNALRAQSSQLSLEKDELVERQKKLNETIKTQASISLPPTFSFPAIDH